jgi:hypothetical protein
MVPRECIIVTEKSGVKTRLSVPAAQMSRQPIGIGDRPGNDGPGVIRPFAYQKAIDEICALNWDGLTQNDLMGVARAYYYFSVQFRENLEIACKLFPEDADLKQLKKEECHTDNLSPWPGVATAKEQLNHDEFMRRLLELNSIDENRKYVIEETGRSYLEKIRQMDLTTRATSIASYEDGGLESVFRAILRSRHWDSALLQAFRHFLVEHIKFDSDSEKGHGALSRHMTVNDQILPLWIEFHHLLVQSVPRLIGSE